MQVRFDITSPEGLSPITQQDYYLNILSKELSLIEKLSKMLDFTVINWFETAKPLIHSINGMLQIFLDQAHCTTDEKRYLFSLLLAEYQRPRPCTKDWPSGHPLQNDEYERRKAMLGVNCYTWGYSVEQREAFFPLFLLDEDNLYVLKGELLNKVQKLKTHIETMPTTLIKKIRSIEKVHNTFSTILQHLEGVKDYAEFLLLCTSLKDKVTLMAKQDAIKLAFKPRQLTTEDIEYLLFSPLDFSTYLKLMGSEANPLHASIVEVGRCDKKTEALTPDARQIAHQKIKSKHYAVDVSLEKKEKTLFNNIVLLASEAIFSGDELFLRVVLQDGMNGKRIALEHMKHLLITLFSDVHTQEFYMACLKIQIAALDNQTPLKEISRKVAKVKERYHRFFVLALEQHLGLYLSQDNAQYQDIPTIEALTTFASNQEEILEGMITLSQDRVASVGKLAEIEQRVDGKKLKLTRLLQQKQEMELLIRTVYEEKIAMLEQWLMNEKRKAQTTPISIATNSGKDKDKGKTKSDAMKRVEDFLEAISIESPEGKALLLNANIDPSEDYVICSSGTNNLISHINLCHSAALVANSNFDEKAMKISRLTIVRGANLWKIASTKVTLKQVADNNVLFDMFLKASLEKLIQSAHLESTDNTHRLITFMKGDRTLKGIILACNKFKTAIDIFYKRKLQSKPDSSVCKNAFIKAYANFFWYAACLDFSMLLPWAEQIQSAALQSNWFGKIAIDTELKKVNLAFQNFCKDMAIINSDKQDALILSRDLAVHHAKKEQEKHLSVYERQSQLVVMKAQESLIVSQHNQIEHLIAVNDELDQENQKANKIVKVTLAELAKAKAEKVEAKAEAVQAMAETEKYKKNAEQFEKEKKVVEQDNIVLRTENATLNQTTADAQTEAIRWQKLHETTAENIQATIQEAIANMMPTLVAQIREEIKREQMQEEATENSVPLRANKNSSTSSSSPRAANSFFSEQANTGSKPDSSQPGFNPQ